jgi:internalin A
MAGTLRRDLAKDYGLTLSWRFAEVEFLGLPKLKDDRVYRLEHIYVPLRLSLDWKDRFEARKTFHIPQILQNHRHLMVLGDPGSGKSTLIKVLTYAFGEAKDNAYKRACGELIPIPIILRLYNTRRWHTYHDMLRDFIATLDEDIRSEITPEWLIVYLTAGRAILMVDGVDEVGSRAEREHLRDEVILPLLKDAPRAWIFITSRVVGYDEVPFEFKISHEERHPNLEGGLECLYVVPFNDEEIRQFVIRWYALREAFPDRQQEGIESLMRALNQNDRVKRLANNPQLLTLIALVHRVTANLPSGRVELYDKIVEAYLETIQVFRKLGTPARLDEMKRWLANVGWRMQMRRDEVPPTNGAEVFEDQGDELLVGRSDIKRWLVEAIEKERGAEEAPIAAERFLDYVARRSGLLVPRGPEEFSFVHLTFQEYFAAFALRGRVRNFDQLAADCTQLVEKRHWHETLNLLFEMLTEFPGACDELFEAILNHSENSDTAAEFISLLLPDEQSGLSLGSQARAAELVLSNVCQESNPAILKNLRQLRPSLFNKWVKEPLVRRLRTAMPSTFPENFFRVGRELIDNWPELVCKTINARSADEWTPVQVATMTLTCRGAEAANWASDLLDVSYWVSPVSELHETLADELLPVLLRDCQHSARRTFLALTGLISILSDVQLLRLSLIESRFYEVQSLALVEIAARRKRDSPFFASSPSGVDFVSTPFSRWSLIRLLATTSNEFPLATRELLWRALLIQREGFESPLSQEEPKTKRSPLIDRSVSAVCALDNTDKDTLGRIIQSLNEALLVSDDWTRLVTIYCLISLGEGTPHRCLEMNQLLDSAVSKPQSFTFPEDLRPLVISPVFTAEEFPKVIRLLFWHEPGNPILDPKLFDSRRKESKFFLTNPSALLKLGAEIMERQ